MRSPGRFVGVLGTSLEGTPSGAWAITPGHRIGAGRTPLVTPIFRSRFRRVAGPDWAPLWRYLSYLHPHRPSLQGTSFSRIRPGPTLGPLLLLPLFVLRPGNRSLPRKNRPTTTNDIAPPFRFVFPSQAEGARTLVGREENWFYFHGGPRTVGKGLSADARAPLPGPPGPVTRSLPPGRGAPYRFVEWRPRPSFGVDGRGKAGGRVDKRTGIKQILFRVLKEVEYGRVINFGEEADPSTVAKAQLPRQDRLPGRAPRLSHVSSPLWSPSCRTILSNF